MARETFNPDGLFDATDYRFNQGRREGDTLYLSGQVGMDGDLTVVGDDAAAQTRRAFENLGTLLSDAGAGLDDVTKIVGYVVDLESNLDGYRTGGTDAFEGPPYPCHTLIGVDQLSPIGDSELLVEIDATVHLPE